MMWSFKGFFFFLFLLIIGDNSLFLVGCILLTKVEEVSILTGMMLHVSPRNAEARGKLINIEYKIRHAVKKWAYFIIVKYNYGVKKSFRGISV